MGRRFLKVAALSHEGRGPGTGVVNCQLLWDLIKILFPLLTCLGMSHPRPGWVSQDSSECARSGSRARGASLHLVDAGTKPRSLSPAPAESECSSVPTLGDCHKSSCANKSQARATQRWAKMPPSQSSGF